MPVTIAFKFKVELNHTTYEHIIMLVWHSMLRLISPEYRDKDVFICILVFFIRATRIKTLMVIISSELRS